MKYTVTTQSICIATYTVKADSPEQAEDRLYEGYSSDERFIDFQNEEVIKVEELDETS